MTVSPSIETFLDLVRKSGAVDSRRLEQFLKKQEPLPETPSALADLLIQNGLLTKYQAEPLLKGKLQRFLLSGKYRVLDRLGAGGMASVFLCEHRVMRRRVAIKILPPNMAKNPAAVDRFHREARAAAALQHQNIVAAHDVDVDGNFHFLVTEYVEGRNLHEMVRINGPQSVERSAHYIAQAALGLQHAYERGMVHRDIKPANLLLDRTGVVKILDMGLALLFHEDEDNLTKEHDAASILGTAEFLAPEQAMDSHAVDIRADIYSLGMTFYFLLTGKTPFGEGTTAQKLIWHQIRPPKPIQEYRPDVPDEMWAVIQKMLAKAPEDRYQTPIEVVMALALWTSQPIAPPAESEMPRPLIPLAADAPTTEGGYSSAGASFMSLPAMNLPSLLEPTSSTNMLTPSPATRAAPPSSSVQRATSIAATSPAKSNPPSQSRPVAPPSGSNRVEVPKTTADPAAPTAGPSAKTTSDAPRAAGQTKSSESNSGPPSNTSDKRSSEPKKKKKKSEAKKKSPVFIGIVAVGIVAILLVGGLTWALSGSSKPKRVNPNLVALETNDKTAAARPISKTPATKSTTATKATTPTPPPTRPTPPPTRPTPPPTQPTTPPTKPATPVPPAPTITADFYPLTPRELFYDVFQFIPNANAWAYTRQKLTFKEDGAIDLATVQQGLAYTMDTSATPAARSVNLKGVPQHARIEASMVEYGTLPNPKAKQFNYEPILKLGSKQADTWNLKLPDGDQRTYTVVAFSNWGEGKPAVTIRSSQPYTIAGTGSQLVSTHVYAKGIGEVERTINILVKRPDGSEQSIPQLYIKLHQ